MYTIAIVGMGSRGLSLLEQFIALSRANPHLPLQLDLFDPGTPGSGLHLSDQPDYLMLNTMAGQISAFCTAHPATQPPGPSFLQWCQARDLRLDARGHVDPSGQGRPLAFADFVPRRLLGLYLQDSYRWLLGHCPAQLQVRHYPQRVSRALPAAGGSGWQLTTQEGTCHHYHGLFITSGHAPATPLPAEPGARVAIEGLGLSAMDCIAELTQGRGGRYVADNGLAGWRYLPSGREPQIYLYSRSGLPFHARPSGFDAPCQPWPRLFFTAEAIERLRAESGCAQLDFARDLLPLITDEMRAVFYQASVSLAEPQGLPAVQQALRETAQRDELFAQLARQWGAFEPLHWMPMQPWTGDDYPQWLRRWLEQDLIRSRLGRRASPLTQALEVWRDYRDLLRLAVDHDGLLAHSRVDFYRRFAGLSNRLVGGPQQERYEDLLALLDAGVVHLLAPGQVPAQLDCIVRARNAHSGLSLNASGLLGDLQRQGLIRAAQAFPADGVLVNDQHRAIRADGCAHSRLWLLGPVVEGSTFYNHYVPTPDPHCLAPLQARRAVQDCLGALASPCAVAC
ncbi:FAD/NAD(P)-binding protein [Pseudomonas sp. 21LCFQ02]|uniref:FAD/NAD(P)-binding protein n=1 Tax=Pseudomonas sp. 21LCFQ02 TaxID=2957505 RepID=UPI00209ACC3C|nr:FAD/NAD(P)-binding domain-containing protein [Pseudomonas sp. 21LCFQ02]MCO8166776.1 FAD/NAD(P)-binding protein [Pseudomonas sp. 21LCFQ02]